MNSNQGEEILLQGTAISEGVAIGVPYILVAEEVSHAEFPISHSQVAAEITRYRKALFSSKHELLQLQQTLSGEGSQEAVTIIDTHIQMLEDPLITTHIEERVNQTKYNIESVFHSVINEYTIQFSKNADSFFKQRISDVQDLSNRILGHLQQTRKEKFKNIPSDSILIAKELAPSEIAASSNQKILGFVTETSSGHSHASLIARAKGIPFVGNISIQELKLYQVSQLIIDGNKGVIILNPSQETIAIYEEILKQQKEKRKVAAHCSPITTTRDGKRVHLKVNITHHEEIESLDRLPCEGVGLFRSEFLALENHDYLFSEELQYQIYHQLISKLAGKACVIRLFDIGGDKLTDHPKYKSQEANPALGFRGIRFLLKHAELLQIQLRAILRAASGRTIRILVPLVMDAKEIQLTKEHLKVVWQQLSAEGIVMPTSVEVGAMIEVPSAALTMDTLVEECDFFSIGTNDLVQYLLAIDRTNVGMEEFCLPIHPSVIRVLNLVIDTANKAGKPISICGELASNLLFAPLFVGMGVKTLSCTPSSLPVLKEGIESLSLKTMRRLAQEVRASKSCDQMIQVLSSFYEENLRNKS